MLKERHTSKVKENKSSALSKILSGQSWPSLRELSSINRRIVLLHFVRIITRTGWRVKREGEGKYGNASEFGTILDIDFHEDSEGSAADLVTLQAATRVPSLSNGEISKQWYS
jgi:hypothetical protein